MKIQSVIFSRLFSIDRFRINIKSNRCAWESPLLAQPKHLSVQEIRRLCKMQDYILQNLESHLTIALLAKQFKVSDFTLKRGFKVLFNTTIHAFILDRRLEKARKLIMDTDKPIKEIAALCGFKSITTFANDFRKKLHITPNGLRSACN